ncbi:hypothetical protein [Succinatimonas hippei]|uniref:hypothetical protein n=1 Tax=Succinatimonas hippei TaxID=626938 RepID=UPI0026F2AD27|nr:hypothetical protein [Succinatimonas hippei]
MSEHYDSLSPKERELIASLKEIVSLSENMRIKLERAQKELSSLQATLSSERRSMIELKEENQHLREVLQNWRNRMNSVLEQLGEIK